ncbi:hypothetical protein FUA23_07065 [Neolewinella aurantiaca]|uniref:Uncharacterized protein n=1 Tax=Neolewinella aurantiaca TaxID=2602767 RepID=A0A5C7FVD5_9BACT|nr:hypothetical protein [Neolewinella aurantiaca]TXF90272.1 hypothetical protein FUA23_07065 [Neolewinella aurantiaca]
MKYLTLTIVLLLFWALNAGAQDCSPLSPSNSGSGILSGILGDDSQSIEGACELATGHDYYTARLEYTGYDDKEYKLIGRLLDANRRTVEGCAPVAVSLSGKPSSADIRLRFDAGANNSEEDYIAVRYLKVTIVASDDPLSELDMAGLTLTGKSAEFRVDHRFRDGTSNSASSSSDVTVSVSFSPVGSASSIKQ